MPSLDARAGNSATDSPSQAKEPAAASVEKIYNSFAEATDQGSFIGLNAADAASTALRADFLSSIQNPVLDSANRTPFARELDQLERDALRGDHTLEATALDWGIRHLMNIGATTQSQLADEANPKTPDRQSPDAQFDQFMAGYLADHFQSIAYMGHSREAPSQSIGVGYLTLSDVSTSLNVDEAIRTYLPAPRQKGWLEKLEDWL